MSQVSVAQVFHVVERHGPAGRVVLRHRAADRGRLLVIAAYEGPELPATVTDPRIDAAGTAPDRFRLTSAEGRIEFSARACDWLEERPALYAAMHGPFALSTTDRLAVRVLLWLLRLPGGARLVRRWHARRAA